VESRLQRRIQRYGWDLAAADYEGCWDAQLATVRAAFLLAAGLKRGAKVLDVACGSGKLSVDVASMVGPSGSVTGVDISGEMIRQAHRYARQQVIGSIRFERMDAERLEFESSMFDIVLCSLGLMYTPDVTLALQEMRRVLAPGGHIVFTVWGRREACGWAGIFDAVQAEVKSEVCPLFFALGRAGSVAGTCSGASLRVTSESRLVTALRYPDAAAASDAATLGGPIALAWSRFDEPTRERVKKRYLATLEPWRSGQGYLVPAEFVIVSATHGIRRT
jgi:SAM-dependent methyltransferase